MSEQTVTYAVQGDGFGLVVSACGHPCIIGPCVGPLEVVRLRGDTACQYCTGGPTTTCPTCRLRRAKSPTWQPLSWP